MDEGVSVVLGLAEGLVSQLQLVRQVVDVSLERVNLLDTGLLSVLHIS